MAARPVIACASCGTAVSNSACSRCGTVFYCSRACQKLGWQSHKPQCAPPEVAQLLRHSGLTPLHVCSMTGCVESAGLMLKLGFDVDMRSSEDHTPLMEAAFHGQPLAIACLLHGGADANAEVVAEVEENVTFTALTFACLHAGTGRPGASAQALACLRLLLSRGATCAAEDMVAASDYGSPEMIALVAAHCPAGRGPRRGAPAADPAAGPASSSKMGGC